MQKKSKCMYTLYRLVRTPNFIIKMIIEKVKMLIFIYSTITVEQRPREITIKSIMIRSKALITVISVPGLIPVEDRIKSVDPVGLCTSICDTKKSNNSPYIFSFFFVFLCYMGDLKSVVCSRNCIWTGI